MAVLTVPEHDLERWPTLGPQVVDWIENYSGAIYGPGEMADEPYRCEPEFVAQLYRAYEVYPRGHKLAGRRRFKRVALSMRKGTAKTEKAMIVAFVESHPSAPVRADGFRKVDGVWQPVGIGVRHPYIPLVAYTLEQTEDLGFDVLRYIIEGSALGDDYDVSLERILVLDDRGKAAGKITPLAGSPSARDGARTTFQHFDETHRMASPRLIKAHTTMQENVYKRVGADAWSLETTTAAAPGEGSIAEGTHAYAEQVRDGKIDDPRLFYFHRQAADAAPLTTPAEVREALLEASGPAASWSADIDGLVGRFFDPTTDREYWRRVWLNQQRADSDMAFDLEQWLDLADAGAEVPKGELITLGFDGARWDDHCGLIGTVVETGHQFVLGHWIPDPDVGIDVLEVDGAIDEAFDLFDVWRFYPDPPRWEADVDRWIGRYGDRRVKGWWTNRPRQMSSALRVYRAAQARGEMTHDGHPEFARHVGNARRKLEDFDADDGSDERAWTIRKRAADSADKIDLAMAGCLSWEARRDAVAAGAKPRKRGGFRSY